MKIAARLLTPALAFVLFILAFGAVPASAAGHDAAAKKAKKVKLSVHGRGQKTLIKKGLKVTVTAKGRGTLKVPVAVTSKTFDKPKATRLAKPEKLKLTRGGKDGRKSKSKRSSLRDTARIELNAQGRAAVNSCEARTITVRAGKTRRTFGLKRDTAPCKPKAVDLSRADSCDFIGTQTDSLCMVPFPDNFYTRADSTSATGRRVDFETQAMPANGSGVNIAAGPYNLNDGFSPGQATVVRIPGIDTADDLAANSVPTLDKLGSYADADKRIVVIDATTGERHPIWAEIDSELRRPDQNRGPDPPVG